MIKKKRKVKKKWRPTFRVRLAISTILGTCAIGACIVAFPILMRGAVRATGICGLILEDIHIEGRLRTSENALDAILREYRHQPMLAFAVQDIRQSIRGLTWVKQVTVRRIWPSVLHIKLAEFEPIATWHHQGKLLWVDRDGEAICEADDSMPQLPAISGEDAPQHIVTFLRQVREYSTLWAHATAFSHVRKRRWNIMVGHTMLVKLPQDNVEQALTRLDSWLMAGKLHPNQVAMLDLRMGDKYILRLQPGVPVHVAKPSA